MGILKGITGFLSNTAKASLKEERVQEPLMIQVVKEAPRTKRQQFADLINNRRDTDGMKKTKKLLNEVSNGRAFDTDCSCQDLPECFRHTNHRNVRRTQRYGRR